MDSAAGDPNLFRYVGNGPTFRVDTSGTMAALALANPAMAPIIPIVEGVVAVGLMGALVYHGAQLMAATQAGMLLDAKLAVAQFQQQMVVQTALMVATAKAMSMTTAELEAREAKVGQAVLKMVATQKPSPNIPPGKDPDEFWKELVIYWNKLRTKLGMGGSGVDPDNPPWPPGGGARAWRRPKDLQVSKSTRLGGPQRKLKTLDRSLSKRDNWFAEVKILKNLESRGVSKIWTIGQMRHSAAERPSREC